MLVLSGIDCTKRGMRRNAIELYLFTFDRLFVMKIILHPNNHRIQIPDLTNHHRQVLENQLPRGVGIATVESLQVTAHVTSDVYEKNCVRARISILEESFLHGVNRRVHPPGTAQIVTTEIVIQVLSIALIVHPGKYVSARVVS